MVFATINTDVSWNKKQKVCAWCFYIACDGERYIRTGIFKEFPKTKQVAEIQGIINAMAWCKRELPEVEGLTLNTGIEILWMINNNLPLEGCESLLKIYVHHSQQFKWQKVKQAGETTSWLNNKIRKIAKATLLKHETQYLPSLKK